MPLVFVTDAPTLWESEYADITGVQYEFPARYRGLVITGDRFVYYRGSRGAALGSGYFGRGVVGDVRPSHRDAHLIATVLDVKIFADAISLRDGNGDYFETGTTTGTNWANGVRRVTDAQYDGIMSEAGLIAEPPRSAPGFADAAHASAMERYSVDVVLSLLRQEFGAAAVREMPVNNPGYDISVQHATGELHVEVKGTVLPVAAFHLSEGQRKHAVFRGFGWRLYVVFGIDVGANTHAVASCEGSELAVRGGLVTEAWRGTLQN